MKSEELKTFGIIYSGTIGSITIAEALPVASFIVAVLTIIYTLCKLVDWIELRIEKRRKKDGP